MSFGQSTFGEQGLWSHAATSVAVECHTNFDVAVETAHQSVEPGQWGCGMAYVAVLEATSSSAWSE